MSIGSIIKKSQALNMLTHSFILMIHAAYMGSDLNNDVNVHFKNEKLS